MVQIHVENLRRTDRPLTWLPEPTCDRCCLPFTNHADELYNRLPLLLSCKHLLCGLCVREHAQSESILCERCNKHVPFSGNYDNATGALHPSYYMLGMLAQMQQELKYIEQYHEDESTKAKYVKDTAEVIETPKDVHIESVSTRDMNTTKKMKTLLEEAFGAYEKAKHALDKRAKSYPENVDQVVQKISAHFLALHNALQIEQDRALQLVRKTYLEHQQQIEQQQQHLLASRKQLLELHASLKSFQSKPHRSDDQPWLQFSGEFKQFLERVPLKLLTAVGSSGEQLAVFYPESGKFLQTISTSYRLKLQKLSKTEQLVPFTTRKKHARIDSDVVEHDRKESSGANLPTHSTRERKVSDRNKHDEVAARKTDTINERTVLARERKHSEESVRDSTASRKPAHEKKCSKNSQKVYEPRVLKEAEKAVLQESFSTVTITYVVNPHEIYVRDELYDDMAAKIVELCLTEAEDYEGELLSGKCQLKVKVGAFYLVQPESSNNWYRALVLEALNSAPEQFGPYRVQYVDYGGKDTVEHDQMRPMSKELSQIEHLAMKCSVNNVGPPGRAATSWPKECYQLMMDFIGNRKMLLYEFDSASDHRVVDIFLPPIIATNAPKASVAKTDVMSWDGYYPPMSLRTMLINLQQCFIVNDANVRNPQVVERLALLKCWMRQATEQAQKRCTIPQPPVLKEYEFLDAHVTYSESPDYFYIMPLEWKKNIFDNLQDQLNAMCQEANALKVFCPYEGLVCGFALDTQDSERVWLRGTIKKVVPGSCWMFSHDTGESIKVSCNDLCLFPPESNPMSVHPLAVCCSLEHIRPKSTGAISAWSGDAIDEFNMLMRIKTLQFAVQFGPLWNESKIYSVLLFLRNKTNSDTCVNKLLVGMGHAECISGREELINDLVHKPNIRKVSDKVAPAAASATAAVEATESNNKVIDPRVPVDLLRVITPREFYVRLSSRKSDLDGLHSAIQQYMDEALDSEVDGKDGCFSGQGSGNSDWCPGDMCLVFTSPSDVHPTEWHRAQITEVQEEGELYEAFLIDRASTVQVHRTNVARIVPQIAQLQPGAVRCQLACIEPLKGSTGWQKVTVDGLKNIIDSYGKHAISLDAKRPKNEDNEATHPGQSLSVVLWGIRVLEQQALAPQKTEYRNINQLLVHRGLAHSSGRFRTFATKGTGALEELQSVEEAVEKMTRCEYEKLQHFFREIAAVSTEAKGFGAQEDGNETAKVVLDGMDTHARVEIDGACAAMLALVSDAVEPIKDWPVGDQIEKTVFVGVPTHVGNDGTVFLFDMCQEPVLHSIRETIGRYVKKSAPSSVPVTDVFQPGEPCLAKYHLDGIYYRGTVVAVIKRNKYSVLFVDYGNEETCHGEDMRKDVVCGRVPVQTNRFRLSGIVPKQVCKVTGSWPEDAIITCHGLIVQQLCKVRVDTSIGSPNYRDEGKVRCPIPCTLFRLNDAVDVRVALLGQGHFMTRKEKEEESMREFGFDDRRVPSRYKKIEYPMTNAAPERNHSPPPRTPEQRDLIQFVQEIDSSFDFGSFNKAFEDPNELPDEADDDSDYLNRAQLLNIDIAEHNDASSESSFSRDGSSSSLQSPASFDQIDLDSSTRMSADEDNQLNMANSMILTEQLPRSSPFLSPIDRNRTVGFFASFTSYGSDLTLHICPQIEGHSIRIACMAAKIQRAANKQTELLQWQASLVDVGDPCLAPYSKDGRYYRAIVEKVCEERAEVTVLYVDYLNRDTVAIADLRKCPRGLRAIPLRNAEVRLKGVRRNPRMREGDIGRRMREVLAQPFFVRIVPSTNPPQPGETFKPEVELFSDYERGVLAYKQMIDERFLYATFP